MINIHCCKEDLTVDIAGHAGSTGEAEFDLVCCGASFAAQMLLYNVEQENELHGSLKRNDLTMDKGIFNLHLVPFEWARVTYKRMMEYAIQGFRMLEERYPEYVRLTEE